MRSVILAGAMARLAIAIWNGFFGPSFGADLDAQGMFHNAEAVGRSLEWDSFAIGTVPYTNVLGTIFYFTTDSLFLGSLFSCFTWVWSAKLLESTMHLVGCDKIARVRGMAIYAFLPSSLMFTSVTLREPFQLFFVNLAVYAALMIYLRRASLYWLVLFAAVLGMGGLHGGLFAFGLFVIISPLVMMAMRGRKSISIGKIALIAPLVVLILLYGLSFFSALSYNLDDGLGSAVEAYQQGGLNTVARTNYKESVEISGITGLLLFLPVSLFQYLFEPMPWRLSSIADVPLLAENLLRAWLIWHMLKGYPTIALIERRRVVLFVLLSFFALETIWSLGTINWGTAARHHIPSIGLLVIAAFASRQLPSSVRKRARAIPEGSN